MLQVLEVGIVLVLAIYLFSKDLPPLNFDFFYFFAMSFSENLPNYIVYIDHIVPECSPSQTFCYSVLPTIGSANAIITSKLPFFVLTYILSITPCFLLSFCKKLEFLTSRVHNQVGQTYKKVKNYMTNVMINTINVILEKKKLDSMGLQRDSNSALMCAGKYFQEEVTLVLPLISNQGLAYQS